VSEPVWLVGDPSRILGSISEGSMVTLKKGTTKISGMALHNSEGDLCVLDGLIVLYSYLHGGWHIAVDSGPVYQAPTEPGLYVSDATGEVWRLRGDGASGRDTHPWVQIRKNGVRKEVPYSELPLTRVEPVKETVREIRDWFLKSEFSWGTVEKDSAMIRALEKDFGVSE
jgi:hypothetical protein